MKAVRTVWTILLLLSLAGSLWAGDKQDKQDEAKEEKPTVPTSTLNNLDAIGSRNVGCDKGIGNWMSLEKQIAMGRQYANQVDQSSKLITDPIVTEYVNRIGQNLVRNSDSKVPFTIKVLDNDAVNAFALPGGFFYVHSGAILAADSESELAGVMAHEIAHVAACHAARQMTRSQIANLASLPLIFMGGWIGYGVANVASFALPATFMKFSRGFENEADFLGIEYLYKSGYDPLSLVTFFEKLAATEKKKPGFMDKAFGSHPLTEDRVQHTQNEISTVLPPRPEYVVDTSEFQQVKARLAAIENKHLPKDERERERPGLRRTTGDQRPSDSGSDPGKTSPKGSDDGPPVLHRKSN